MRPLTPERLCFTRGLRSPLGTAAPILLYFGRRLLLSDELIGFFQDHHKYLEAQS